MKKHNLTHKEENILEKRWFFVKNLISFTDMVMTFPMFLLFHIISLIAMIMPTIILAYYTPIRAMIFYVLLNQSIFIYCIAQYFMTYVFRGKIFLYTNDKWKISSISKKGWGSFLKLYHDLREYSKEAWLIMFSMVFILMPIVMCYIFFRFFEENISSLNVHPYDDYLYPLLTIFLGFYVFGYICRQLVEHFHPLYAFDNLWEKIQKLTPTIEKQSKKIQSEFESDMNFNILHQWFDSLSTTFSSIVTLVIKLERVEARANKWNMFDSEKYINSLRRDIVEPLTYLKTFLEEQKIELLESRKELTHVQVWWSEWSENIELQSKRSESLITELTENIEKLDVMIGKMEK